MSACAGSSTKFFSQVIYLLCHPEQSGTQESQLQTFAGLVRMDSRPGRIGFMSTQRRENRWQRTNCTGRTELAWVPGDRSSSLGWKRSRSAFPGPMARCACANVNGGTAPPGFPAWFHPSDEDLSPGAPEWLATNSLQSGYCTVQLVLQDLRHSPPSFGAGTGEETGTPATDGSSLPHIPSPSGPALLHSSLPPVPAGRRRWAERYDGKGNLHLQHAA
jgi:hypothetical protein